MVSSIEPKIDHPFEKLSQLLNIWIYKESESEYLLSPILFRLGSKNLDINVEEKVNLILGSQIFQKTTLSPYDIMRGIIYYIKGKDYNKAGWHLYQALQLIIKNEAIKEDDVLKDIRDLEKLKNKKDDSIKKPPEGGFSKHRLQINQ